MRIAAEGIFTAKLFLAVAIVFFITARFVSGRAPAISAAGYSVSLLTLLLSLFSLFFFRDPERISPADESILYSPADGKIIKIDEENGNTVIKIFMSVFNVHIQRMPVTAEVLKVEYTPGLFINAINEKADMVNERNTAYFATPGGIKFSVKQIAGLIARRIKFFKTEGDKVKQNDRIGIIYFGSQVDISFPSDMLTAQVVTGQNVTAGATPLGRIEKKAKQ